MNHVNLIGKIIKPLDPMPSDPTKKKEGTAFILETKHTELDNTGKIITRKFNHRIVLKYSFYQKYANIIHINDNLAIEGYLYKGKVIVNDLIIL